MKLQSIENPIFLKFLPKKQRLYIPKKKAVLKSNNSWFSMIKVKFRYNVIKPHLLSEDKNSKFKTHSLK